MLKINQTNFLENLILDNGIDDWTFNRAPTRELTHCYHDYPARMIPQVAGKLLDLFGANAQNLFDPYCGSGTSLVEANIRGINAIGTDLNPLARLIAKSKTSIIKIKLLEKYISKFIEINWNTVSKKNNVPEKIHGITRLDFWFKPQVVQKLNTLLGFIREIKDKEIHMFFEVAFSETVRECSNTRNDEFKLYRYSDDKLEKFNPDVYSIMLSKLKRNFEGYKNYKSLIDSLEKQPSSKIYDFNTVDGIPEKLIPAKSIDIVVTSPPYGDSETTVAYGQYSRLSASWLGLDEPHKIDKKLMGSKASKDFVQFPSNSLNNAIEKIRLVDEKRARKVSSFYEDLLTSISNVAKVIKKGGYACYVVGNRKVKGVVLPTDIAVMNFFEEFGFEHVDTFIRAIPNKRMPSRNSPTNATGVLDNTMTREYIVVMKSL